MTGRATDITNCSVLIESDALPADRIPLSISSARVAIDAGEGVQLLTLHRFSSCLTATLLAALRTTLYALQSLVCGRSTAGVVVIVVTAGT